MAQARIVNGFGPCIIFKSDVFKTSNFDTNIVPWEEEVRNFQNFPSDYILGFSRWDDIILAKNQKKSDFERVFASKAKINGFF